MSTKITTAELENKMRHLPIPIVPRTMNDKVILDVRTIEHRLFKIIVEEIRKVI